MVTDRKLMVGGGHSNKQKNPNGLIPQGSSFIRRQGQGIMNHTVAHSFLNQSQDASHDRSNRSSLNREQANSMTSRDRMGSYTGFEDNSNHHFQSVH